MSRLSHHAVRLLVVTITCLTILTACSFPGIPAQSVTGPTSAAVAPATVAPTAETAEPTSVTVQLDAELQVDQGGFRLKYPDDWHTRALAGSAWAISPSQSALEAETISDNMVVLIDSTPLEAIAEQHDAEVIANPRTFFDFISVEPQNAGFSLGDITTVTVGGHEGKAADLAAAGGAGRLIVVLTPERAVRILGQATPDAWQAQREVFQSIVESVRFFPPPLTPTPTPEDMVQQPLRTMGGSDEVVLRLGGNTGPPRGRFVAARGLTAGEQRTIYLAESSRGVWHFAANGDLISTIGEDELLDAYDVAFHPDGDIFVADYGRNAIAQFDSDGTLVRRWGETGDAPEQFGLSSPQRLAIDPDGSIYALDNRVEEDGSSITSSVVRFNSADGSFVDRIALPEGLNPADLAVDEEGNIFLADTFNKAVIKIDETGQEVARFGTEVTPDGIAASAIDLDDDGNIYVATWDSGILKFAPDGTVLAQGGSVAEADTTPEIGEFSLPNGIAVTPRDIVWVSDNSGEYSALTALRMTTDAEAQATADARATANATPIPEEALKRQWASEATASSAYEGYEAENATGAPDVEGCRDSQRAWASAAPDSLEELELRFADPVFATQVNIHQNHQPGFITNVELLDTRGNATSVYTSTAELQEECPNVLEVSFERTERQIVGVRLTIDQRSGANWNEIDAVELVGLPIEDTAADEAEEPADEAEEPADEAEEPADEAEEPADEREDATPTAEAEQPAQDEAEEATPTSTAQDEAEEATPTSTTEVEPADDA